MMLALLKRMKNLTRPMQCRATRVLPSHIFRVSRRFQHGVATPAVSNAHSSLPSEKGDSQNDGHKKGLENISTVQMFLINRVENINTRVDALHVRVDDIGKGISKLSNTMHAKFESNSKEMHARFAEVNANINKVKEEAAKEIKDLNNAVQANSKEMHARFAEVHTKFAEVHVKFAEQTKEIMEANAKQTDRALNKFMAIIGAAGLALSGYAFFQSQYKKKTTKNDVIEPVTKPSQNISTLVPTPTPGMVTQKH